MFQRISNGLALAQSTWRVLMGDKRLLLFPIVSGIFTLIVIAAFGTPLYLLFREGHLYGADGKLRVWNYPIFFAFYLCCYCVVIFCNSALVACAVLRLNGQPASVGDGFRAAFARKRQILAWALVSASVGIVLMLIESHKTGGRLVARILGTAWSAMTYFVVPVLVVENTGPFRAIRQSMGLLRKTWGEAVAGKVGLGFVYFLLSLPIVALFVAGIYLLQRDHALALGLLGAGGAALACFAVLASAINSVFLTAVYQFARFDRVPAGFDRARLENSFMTKK